MISIIHWLYLERKWDNTATDKKEAHISKYYFSGYFYYLLEKQSTRRMSSMAKYEGYLALLSTSRTIRNGPFKPPIICLSRSHLQNKDKRHYRMYVGGGGGGWHYVYSFLWNHFNIEELSLNTSRVTAFSKSKRISNYEGKRNTKHA